MCNWIIANGQANRLNCNTDAQVGHCFEPMVQKKNEILMRQSFTWCFGLNLICIYRFTCSEYDDTIIVALFWHFDCYFDWFESDRCPLWITRAHKIFQIKTNPTTTTTTTAKSFLCLDKFTFERMILDSPTYIHSHDSILIIIGIRSSLFSFPVPWKKIDWIHAQWWFTFICWLLKTLFRLVFSRIAVPRCRDALCLSLYFFIWSRWNIYLDEETLYQFNYILITIQIR